ncbi:MAG: hypothetical protein EXX96DRAFT_570363 [Benjaminiella poitrasii]|nr:MAG: hypothetical protein EXX96DRAFT_570363 [Benjaminiella poitrasii]
MRTNRRLQITSIVVLSPVLLIILSIVSMLASSIYSNIKYCLFRLITLIPFVQHQQQLLKNISTDVSIPYHQRYFKHTSKESDNMLKRISISILFRLRDFTRISMILLLLYAVYHLLKKTKLDIVVNQQETSILDSIEEEIHGKKKTTKRRKSKKTARQRSRSMMTVSNSPEHNNHHTIVNSKSVGNLASFDDSDSTSTPAVKESHPRQSSKEVEKQTVASPVSSCATTPSLVDDRLLKKTPKDDELHLLDLNFLSPESTPVHSDDEDEGSNNKKSNENWYSPFSTGLDLDILPKTSHQNDPLCLYRLDLTHIPYYHYDSFPIISSLQQQVHLVQKPQSIKILENHPFVPSVTAAAVTAHSPVMHNIFGPVGDKKK